MTIAEVKRKWQRAARCNALGERLDNWQPIANALRHWPDDAVTTERDGVLSVPALEEGKPPRLFVVS